VDKIKFIMYAVHKTALKYIHKIIQIETKYEKFKFFAVLLIKIQIFLDNIS
jgi:hypothetical protein